MINIIVIIITVMNMHQVINHRFATWNVRICYSIVIILILHLIIIINIIMIIISL